MIAEVEHATVAPSRAREPVPSRQSVDSRPLILHVVYRFDTGGLENGVVNLINHLPVAAYRHAVLALTEVVPRFAQRIRHDDVEFISLHKPPGQGFRLYPRLMQLFRRLRPAIVHSRNLAALECQVPAWWAGVPVSIHGEHGRDLGDLDGSRKRYQWLRRAYRPFVDHYVALSSDLAGYLRQQVGVPDRRLAQIHNGVDLARFHPAQQGRALIPGCPFTDPSHFVFGTVGRMQPVKAQVLLARAFVRALTLQPALRSRLRLAMVGEGLLRADAQQLLSNAGLADLAWLPGERSDVADVMRGLDCFVLPSLAEGISNTILEAMASALPVLATDVGGNAELVVNGKTGALVPAGDVEALAQAMLQCGNDPDRAGAIGRAGRARVERDFSLAAMVSAYQGLYDRLLAGQENRAKRT